MKINRSNPNHRRAAVLMSVLVCAAIVGVIFAVTLRTAYMRRRFLDSNYQRLQSKWLAESGVERAIHRLTEDAKYSGEMWLVNSSDIDGMSAGSVEIAVKSESPTRKLVSVSAHFPRGENGATSKREAVVVLPVK